MTSDSMTNIQKNVTAGIFFLGIGALSIYLFFFRQFNTHFTLLFGDQFDAVIEAVLVSHWYHVLQFTQGWNQPLYFYPHHDVLGYNDAYFLYGLIASIYRVLGYNLFISQELMHITVKVIGFISMAVLLRRIIPGKTFINVMSATLFTLCINSSNQAYHGQLFLVAFAPMLTLLLIGMIEAIKNASMTRVYIYGIASALFYDALLITGFYMAWFYGLCLIIFVIAYALVGFTDFKTIFRCATQCKTALVASLFVFIMFALPFLSIYLPKLRETGGQTYADQIFYSLHLADILNFGTGSIVWGKLFAGIARAYPTLWRPGEYRVGFTPDVIVILLLAVTASLTSWRERAIAWHKALALTILIGLVLPISIGNHSLWYFLDLMVPGAHGLRVIARLYIFLAFPATLLISLFLGSVWDRFPRARMLVAALSILMCVSQINLAAPTNLNVPNEMALIRSAVHPPRSCRSFFVVHPVDGKGSDQESLSRNVQAMILADFFELPTLDGQATFIPSNLAFGQRPRALFGMRRYLIENKVTNACEYDIEGRKWTAGSKVDFASEMRPYRAGTLIRFSLAGNSGNAVANGWSSPEPWGTWTDARSAELNLRISRSLDGPMELTFFAHAFLAPAHPTLAVAIAINGVELGHFHYVYPSGGSDVERNLTIPAAVVAASKGMLRIRFDMADPASPASLGLSADPRLLGLGMVWLKVSVAK